MKKKILMAYAMLMAAAMVMIMSGCGKKAVTYNTEDYISVSVSGVDGEGRLSVETCTDEFMQKVNADLFEGKASDTQLASMLLNVAVYAEYAVEGGVDNLSNGDTVTITMQADNDSLRELGLEFALNDFSYTVSGLAEPPQLEALDIWTGFEIEFEGIAPNGSANAVYNGTNDFVKDNVRFGIDKTYGLSNGDTVKVTASCNQSVLDENLYLTDETEKTFTVSGLSFYPSNLNGYDMSEVDSILLELARERMDRSTYMDAYNSGSRIYGSKIFRDGSAGSMEWSVMGEYTIEPVHRYVLADTAGYAGRNIYTVFYEVKIPLEKTYTDKWNPKPDGYNEGDTYELVVYIECHMSDISADDNSIDTSKSKTGATAYGNSFAGNYIGSSLEEIEEEYDSSYADWVKTDAY